MNIIFGKGGFTHPKHKAEPFLSYEMLSLFPLSFSQTGHKEEIKYLSLKEENLDSDPHRDGSPGSM